MTKSIKDATAEAESSDVTDVLLLLSSGALASIKDLALVVADWRRGLRKLLDCTHQHERTTEAEDTEVITFTLEAAFANVLFL